MTLQLLDKYIFLQLANLCSIFFFNTTPQIDLNLNVASKGRPKYFIDSWDILHSKILAMLSIFGKFSTRTIFYLAKFTFNPEIAWKHKMRDPQGMNLITTSATKNEGIVNK